MKFWLYQSLIALDQFINAFLFGGWADETLSARSFREFPRLAKVIDTILWFDPHHCYISYLDEQARLQSPPEERLR